MKKKLIQNFDRIGSDGGKYLDAIFCCIEDEHLDKKLTTLPDKNEWELIHTQQETPRQTNGTFLFTLLPHSNDLL